MSGSSRSLPIGRRVAAVMLALVASRMNFIQSSVWICSLKRGVEAGLLTQREEGLGPLAALAVEFAKDHAHEGADLPDHAGLDDRRADLRHAAHDRLASEDRDQPLGGIDAVLQAG